MSILFSLFQSGSGTLRRMWHLLRDVFEDRANVAASLQVSIWAAAVLPITSLTAHGMLNIPVSHQVGLQQNI